ncbi:MAG: hypothetical protein AAF458_08950 [Pseudomonadota bacterium]
MLSSSVFSAAAALSAIRALAVAAALCLAFWPGLAAAAIDLSVHVGFGQVFRLAHWTPVTITVENRGANVDAVLELVTTAGNALEHRQFNTHTAAHVDLPGGARKRLRFAIMLDSLAYPLRVRLRSGSRVLAETSIDLRKRFTDRELIVVISPDVGLDYLNSKRRISTYARTERLPQQWRGYDGVGAVVVHGISLEKLSESQFRALDRWIQQGGRLIVSGRADYGLLRTPRLSRLLPTAPVGLRRISWSAILGEQGANRGSRSAHVHRVADAGEVTHARGDVPLALRRAHGLGSVAYLTFDLANAPFNLAAVTAPIWGDLLPEPDDKPMIALAEPGSGDALPGPNRAFQPGTLRPDQRLSDAVLATRAFGFPALGSMLMFLAFYLGLLATLQHLGREQTAALTGWGRLVAPPAFVALAWTLFAPTFPAGPTAIAVASVQPLPESPLARVDIDLALFSTSRASPAYSLRGTDPSWRPLLASQDGYRPPDWTFTRGNRADQQRISVSTNQSYVLHALEGHALIPFRLRAEATFSDGSYELTVSNESRQQLRGAWLQLGQDVWAVGAVGAGETIRRILPARDAQPARADVDTWQDRLRQSGMLTRGERTGAGAVLARLVRKASPRIASALQAGNGRLFGFVAAPLTIETDGGTPPIVVGLLDTPAPLTYADGGEVDVRRFDPASPGLGR